MGELKKERKWRRKGGARESACHIFFVFTQKKSVLRNNTMLMLKFVFLEHSCKYKS